jgi:hypothetical protein
MVNGFAMAAPVFGGYGQVAARVNVIDLQLGMLDGVSFELLPTFGGSGCRKERATGVHA